MREETTLLTSSSSDLSSRLVFPSYTATLFLSAALLFLVQPMIGKMMLPHLGGSPSVWNTIMCFFQMALLCGYLYAHLLSNAFSVHVQGLIHGVVLIACAAFLPLDLSQAVAPVEHSPALWVIGKLAVTVGPPFVAVSATAPLLQRWFSHTGHATAADPYFLYAASNCGSLAALLAYPLLIEPNLPLHAQSQAWTAVLAVAALGIAACWSSSHPGPTTLAAREVRSGYAERLQWTAYAFVPSALLLAVTAHITTDLASAPLFWVIPLALYLATFIFAFARRPPLSHGAMLKAQRWLIIPLVTLSPVLHSIWLLLVHLALFFVTAMVCHGELARRRPPVEKLTQFYFYVSLGGVLGGIFTALLAPALFRGVWEYPLLLAVSCLALPPALGGRLARLGDIAFPAALLAGLLGGLHALPYAEHLPNWIGAAILALVAGVLLHFSERRIRFALGVGACLLVGQIGAAGQTLETARSFFGVYKVRLDADEPIHVLVHGTTAHGAESLVPGEETIPLAYYSPEGPFGRFFSALAGREPKRVGVIGLGTGSLVCYARVGQAWTFHEIDPLAESLARNTGYFRFLDRCGSGARVILGDARLTLQDVPDRSYDAIIVDAFGSDSIPIHLLTREALTIYHRKLSDDGVILFHISNRHLELAPAVAALAEDAGAQARHLLDLPPGAASIRRVGTEVVAVSQRGRALDDLRSADGWQVMPPPPASALWTDTRSDIIGRLKWRRPSGATN